MWFLNLYSTDSDLVYVSMNEYSDKINYTQNKINNNCKIIILCVYTSVNTLLYGKYRGKHETDIDRNHIISHHLK